MGYNMQCGCYYGAAILIEIKKKNTTRAPKLIMDLYRTV